MPKVVHVRDVPDDVHAALVDAAEAQGVSLTRYLRRELEQLAARSRVVQHNLAVIRRARADVGDGADRATILSVLDEARSR